jgi:hypothetical protein
MREVKSQINIIFEKVFGSVYNVQKIIVLALNKVIASINLHTINPSSCI